MAFLAVFLLRLSDVWVSSVEWKASCELRSDIELVGAGIKVKLRGSGSFKLIALSESSIWQHSERDSSKARSLSGTVLRAKEKRKISTRPTG